MSTLQSPVLLPAAQAPQSSTDVRTNALTHHAVVYVAREEKRICFSLSSSHFSPFQSRLCIASVDPPWSTCRTDSCFPQRSTMPSKCCHQWGQPIDEEGATILGGATHTGIPPTSGDLDGARDSFDLVRALWHWGTETMGAGYLGALEKKLKMASDSLSRNLPGEMQVSFSFVCLFCFSSLQRVDPETQIKGQSSERIGDLSQVTLSQYKVSKQSTPSDPHTPK